MKHYYLANPNSLNGFEEVTETEFRAIVGDKTTQPYATPVYQGKLSINEVPEDVRDAVQAVVDAKITKFGEYDKQDVPANELKSMIEEVV